VVVDSQPVDGSGAILVLNFGGLLQGILKGEVSLLLTPRLTGLDYSVLQIKTKIVSCHTADSKPVKTGGQQYSDTSPFSIPWLLPYLKTLNLAISGLLQLFTEPKKVLQHRSQLSVIRRHVIDVLKRSFLIDGSETKIWRETKQ
jgi:hypothetical protein